LTLGIKPFSIQSITVLGFLSINLAKAVAEKNCFINPIWPIETGVSSGLCGLLPLLFYVCYNALMSVIDEVEDHQEIKRKQQGHNDKFEGFKIASLQNQQINSEHRQLLTNYYDKIIFYSAGAFSFTLALVGLVIENKVPALRASGFLFANVFWLYFSWGLFLLAGIFALVAKKIDAYQLANAGMSEYDDKRKNVGAIKKNGFAGEVVSYIRRPRQSNRHSEV